MADTATPGAQEEPSAVDEVRATLSAEEIERRTRIMVEERLEEFGEITSRLPGRTRFRLKSKYRTPEFIASHKAKVESQPGVKSVSINPRTGSVLILYDENVFKPRNYLETFMDIEQIAAGVLELPSVELQAEDAEDERSRSDRIADAIFDLTVTIYEKTGLRLTGYAVPAAIGGLGIFQIATYGIALETLSGPFLLYIAWDIFIKLRAEPPLPPTREQSTADVVSADAAPAGA